MHTNVCLCVFAYLCMCVWRAVCVCVLVCVCMCVWHVRVSTCLCCGEHRTPSYGVATVSRIDKITGFFCRISSLL